ncbi:MAG TPA: Rrf2 family transcriptional regulator [Sedimentisphaerales bacterium]|nr:Rrf2 family transcriptional regulator [Sedimentisphaerales bacterium]
MDILRRNTDYALRLMVSLARHGRDASISTRSLAQEQDVPYQLACKLMQQLHAGKLVESYMGARGGFRLGREPGRVSLLDVVEVIQGRLSLNRCLLSKTCCPRTATCPVRAKMGELQNQMEEYLGKVTLADLIQAQEGAGETETPVRRTK